MSNGGATVPGRLVVICTHGLMDHLVAPLMLDYLLRIQEGAPQRAVLLFTEEPPGAAPPPAEVTSRMHAARIEWVAHRYDVHGRQWWQKLRIAIGVLRRTRGFMRGGRHRTILGYLSLAGAYAVVLRWLGLGDAGTVCFEPHSRYMRELGIWGRWSLKYLLLAWLERAQMRHARVLVVPTRATAALAMAAGRRQQPRVQGITIDVGAGVFDPGARAALRRAHGWGDERVLVYVGKFGGIYHSVDQYMTFLGHVAEHDPQARFHIITWPEFMAAIAAHPRRASLASHLSIAPPVEPAALHRHLSACDLGVVAIPPTPSQLYRSPVKTAYYWAAGLPIVVPRGVSDDHLIAAEERVGIVVDDLHTVDGAAFAGAVRDLFREGADAVRQRCIRAAFRYRDTGRMVAALNDALA